MKIWVQGIVCSFIIALLFVILGEVIRVRVRAERIYEQIFELDYAVSGGLLTGKVGEHVE